MYTSFVNEQDFATRSLDMTEESPGQIGEAVALGMDVEEEEDEMLQHLQLKRRWETRYDYFTLATCFCNYLCIQVIFLK